MIVVKTKDLDLQARENGTIRHKIGAMLCACCTPRAGAHPPAILNRFASNEGLTTSDNAHGEKGCQASKTAFRGSEAFCPNIQPRAHARLTGLTRKKGPGHDRNMTWPGLALTRAL